MKTVKMKLVALLLFIATPLLLILAIDSHVKSEASNYIVGLEDAPQVDAILVLGAKVRPDGSVSDMLGDRLKVALALEAAGKSDKFIVSGDHGRIAYDEVNAMRNFLEQRNIQPEHIFMDHAGFSTYESIYRARDIFKTRKVLIVTQHYHLMRAVYTARQMGLDAYGVASDIQLYGNMTHYQMREILARTKDFAFVQFLNPKPTYLGTPIPITEDGRLTADGKS